MARTRKNKASNQSQGPTKVACTRESTEDPRPKSSTHGPQARFSMTFPVLRDLITACTTYKPFAAPYGSVEKAWQNVTQKLNEDLHLRPKMSWEVARSTIHRLRKMHEEGISPSALKLKLTDQEHTAIASGLDGLSTAYRKHEEVQAGLEESKKQQVIQQAAAGARVRDKAITRLSQRNGAGGSPSTSSTIPVSTPSNSLHQPERAVSVPVPEVPRPSTSTHSIGGIVSDITSAINQAEGYQIQRQETFQNELIRSVQDLAKSETRSAEALEGIFEVLKDIRNSLLPQNTSVNDV